MSLRLRPLSIFLLALALIAAPALQADEAEAEPVVATAVALEGHAQVMENGGWNEVELGQLFSEGDQLRTAEQSSLHLILADGSSLVLGPNSELALKAMGDGSAGSKTVIQLLNGLLNTMVEKLKSGSTFEIDSGDAVASVKGTDFEVQRSQDADATVTVNEGIVQLGGQDHQQAEDVRPGMQSRFRQHRVEKARALSSAERHSFRLRWAAAHRIHKNRVTLMKRFRRSNPVQRQKFLDAVRHRHAVRTVARPKGISRAQARQDNKGKHPLAAAHRKRLLNRKNPGDPNNP